MSKKTKSEERARKAAEALAARKRAERRRNILVGAGVVVAVAAIVGAGFAINKATDDGPSGEATAATSEYDVAIGDEDAPHTIVIYEDFICPVCGALETASAEKLEQAAEEGKVYVSYRPFNLFSDPSHPAHDYSIDAASAFAVVLEEEGPEVAKEFHDLLFAEQPPEAGPHPDADWLVEKAVEAGADEDAVREGIEEGAGEDWVEEATEAATDAGINSTPTILLDGEEYREGRTFEELADNLVAEVS